MCPSASLNLTRKGFISPRQLNVAMTHTELLETGYEALGVSNTGPSHKCAMQ